MEKKLDEVYISDDDMLTIVKSCVEAIDDHKLLISNLTNLEEQPLLAFKLVHKPKDTLDGLKDNTEFITFHYEKFVKDLNEYPGDERKTRAKLKMKLEQNGSMMFKYEWLIIKPNDAEKTLELDQNLVKVGEKCQNIDLIYERATETSQERYIDTWIWRFFYINFFLKNIPAAVSESKHTVQETVSSGGKGIHRTYKHKVYLVKEHHINLSKVSKTHINKVFTCLAWGVRGHFRHLKDGKVVFVQPYRKGKERNNPDVYVSKQYLL